MCQKRLKRLQREEWRPPRSLVLHISAKSLSVPAVPLGSTAVFLDGEIGDGSLAPGGKLGVQPLFWAQPHDCFSSGCPMTVLHL